MKINGTGEKLKRFVASLLLSVASLHTRVNIVTSFISSPRTLKEETIEVFKLEEKKIYEPLFSRNERPPDCRATDAIFIISITKYQVSGTTTFTAKKNHQCAKNVTWGTSQQFVYQKLLFALS